MGHRMPSISLPSTLIWACTLGVIFAPQCMAVSPGAASLTQEIRDSEFDMAECYRVRDLSFNKDEVKLFFNDGYLIFSKPVLGERVAAVFTSDVEGGDGEVILIPPSRSERASLAAFTQSPNLDEHLNAALMIFTDRSAAALLENVRQSEASKKVPETGALLARQWSSVLQNIIFPMRMRIVEDLLSAPAARQGVAFFAFSGKTLSAFDVISDDRMNRRIEARQLVTRDGKDITNIWTSFLPRDVRNQPEAHKMQRAFRPVSYKMDVEIAPDMLVKATTRAQVKIGDAPTRVFSFSLSTAMHVDSVKIDGTPAELIFDESTRSRPTINGLEDDFLAVSAEPLEPGSVHELEFQHQGNVISTRGDGVYFVNARNSWYPHITGSFVTYDATFRYPKRLTLVAAGVQVEDRVEGDLRITRRQTAVPIAAAGFNLGVYQKVTGTAAGVTYEVYGNRNLEEALRPKVVDLPILPSRPPPVRSYNRTPPMQPLMINEADPVARLRAVAADLSSSLEFFAGLFGPPVLKTLTVAPIPGTFGQGFPGLVYLSTFAYLSPMERPLALRTAREQAFFSDILVPHEAAHQWWGGVVTSERREDHWLVESLANYSALLWLEKKRGYKEVEQVLDGYRDELLAKSSTGDIFDSAGPVIWGERLQSSPIAGAWRVITYDKGTWILHMLRRRLGDEVFFKMLMELRKRYESRPLTTAEFAALVRELRPPSVSVDAIDAFFENWVYQTGIPALKVRSSITGMAPAVKLSGVVEQTDSEGDFSADVPVEVQFPKGAPQTIWVRMNSDRKSFSATLPQTPSRIAISNDVLMKR